MSLGAPVYDAAPDCRSNVRQSKRLAKLRNVLGVAHEKDTVFLGKGELLLWVADQLPTGPSNRDHQKAPVTARFECPHRAADEGRLAVDLELLDLEAKAA